MKPETRVREFRLKLYPADFYRVRAFYKDELSYSIVHEWDREDSKGVMFDIGGTTLELLWPSENRNSYRADVSWEVNDVWKLFDQMKDKPYLLRGLVDNSWGDTSFHIQDPEGFRITFFTRTK